jgi:hypothetical protein
LVLVDGVSFRIVPPGRHFIVLSENPDDEGHAVELAHTQVILLLGKRVGAGKTIEEHPHPTPHELLHLVTGKVVTLHAVLDTLLFRARVSLAFLIRQPATPFAAITANILCRVVLVPEVFPPSIDEFLSRFCVV